MKDRHVVMGLVSGYPLYYIRPFFTSLFRTGFNGDVVIFMHNLKRETEEFLDRNGVVCIPYENDWPFSKEVRVEWPTQSEKIALSPNSLRYLLYYAFLKENAARYDKVMISDVRDVYFQKNPFEYKYEPGLSVFYEDEGTTIGMQKYNKFWIENGFGVEMLNEVFTNPISCSGVTIGDTPAMLKYFETMIPYIVSIPNIQGLDQGIHNVLLHRNLIPQVAKYYDDEGPVSTISEFKPKNKVNLSHGTVLGRSGKPVNIVHQYDRHDRLLLRWNPQYFIKHKIELTKRNLYFLKRFVDRVRGKKLNDGNV
jgi:hypothetical protein